MTVPAAIPARWWEPLPSVVTPAGRLGVVAPGTLVDLRRAVLRDGRQDLPAAYPSDLDPTTLHLGVVAGDGRVVGAVTVRAEPWPGFATLQLALMAVAPDLRRRGVGASLVRTVQAAGVAAGYDVWAAARLEALDFYRSLGFRPLGDRFTGAMELPHRRVLWRRPVG